jgi:putative transcriptional regulator
MSKAFEMIKAGLEDALAHAKGRADKSKYKVHVPAQVDVKKIRTELGLSQDEFAQRFSFTAARVRDWEQGRSKPDSAARAYLTVIKKERKAVERALKAG